MQDDNVSGVQQSNDASDSSSSLAETTRERRSRLLDNVGHKTKVDGSRLIQNVSKTQLGVFYCIFGG